tara:strand:- start:238 stop:756 length:519 start_codon:yes stop_codon:yes gene_type:complete
MAYKLVICELHIPDLHGFMENSSENIYLNYLVTTIITLEEFYSYEYLNDIGILNECYQLWLLDNISIRLNNNIEYSIYHPYIRNYINIITNDNYIKVDIAYVEELEGEEMVGYIKTYWLRLIQRKWKKIYKKRKEIIAKRNCIKSLNTRSLTGLWPKGLLRLPTLLGMLNKL